MRFEEFKLERFFALHEFNVKVSLSSSDCETLKVSELLDMANSDMKDKWNNLDMGYTQSKGHPLLLDEISKLYNHISVENIISVVPQEGVFIAMSSILQKGDHVIVMHPVYQSLSEVPKALGCEVSSLPLTRKSDKWMLDLNMLRKMIKKETKLLVFNFSHNPTGYLPSIQEYKDIIELARSSGIYIFLDEMYRLLEYNEADRLPPIASAYERGISLSGLSKAYGLPGLRSGWLVTQGIRLCERFAVQKDYTTICGSAPGEILSIIALQAKDSIIARILDIVKSNIILAESFFTRHNNTIGWIPPRAGSVAVGELKNGRDAEQFCNDVIKEKSLLILPGRVFDFGNSYFRLGLGRRNFKEGLEILDEYLCENELEPCGH